MSGIAGIYNLDGRPVDRALLGRMMDRISHRGPDGMGCWIEGPVGLGHLMLHTTPESLHETQPLTDETGTLSLTLDGRVDNREELWVALESAGTMLRTDTDAEMVLRAYQCWGTDCLKEIVGDFALAIWDQRNRQLFCARDILGMKPFYYYTDGRTFLWGSEIRPLFEDPTVRREPNEGMVAEYLASAITDHEETLYRGVLRLPPAHFLLVRPGQLRKEKYWDLDPAREIRYPTDRDYAEHFLLLFKEAVRCRLRSHGPAAVTLSGGLDSSSVVGMAQSLYREGALAYPGFETFSLAFPGLPCDESNYINDVVRMWDIKANVVCPAESDTSCYADQVRRYHDVPDYPNGTMFDPLSALAREKGFRVLLTGLGGDDWLTGSAYHYADLLRELRLFELRRQARFDSRVSGIILPSFPILRLGLWPLLPRTARRAIKRILGRDGVPPWIGLQFAQRTHVNERIRKDVARPQFSSIAQQDLLDTGTSGWQTHFLEIEDRAASWFGLEERHPFDDRRVIEFALALPEDQRWRGDQPKFILRQAMRGLLPETVRQRVSKADFSHTFVWAFQSQGGERLFDSLTIASLGWVDGAQVRALYQRMAQRYARGDEGYIHDVWPLWMIFAMELWFTTACMNRDLAPPGRIPIPTTNTQPV